MLLEKYREACHLYLKIDFGILAAFVTIATVFRFERPEVIELLGSFNIELIIIVIFITVDFIAEHWFLMKLGPDDITKNEKLLKNARKTIGILFFSHILLFSGLTGVMFSTLRIYVPFINQKSAYYYGTMATSSYIEKYHIPPKSLQDLTEKIPNVKNYLMDPTTIKFNYEFKDSSKYYIILPGPDGKIGTVDDWKRPAYVEYDTIKE